MSTKSKKEIKGVGKKLFKKSIKDAAKNVKDTVRTLQKVLKMHLLKILRKLCILFLSPAKI